MRGFVWPKPPGEMVQNDCCHRAANILPYRQPVHVALRVGLVDIAAVNEQPLRAGPDEKRVRAVEGKAAMRPKRGQGTVVRCRCGCGGAGVRTAGGRGGGVDEVRDAGARVEWGSPGAPRGARAARGASTRAQSSPSAVPHDARARGRLPSRSANVTQPANVGAHPRTTRNVKPED